MEIAISLIGAALFGILTTLVFLTKELITLRKEFTAFGFNIIERNIVDIYKEINKFVSLVQEDRKEAKEYTSKMQTKWKIT